MKNILFVTGIQKSGTSVFNRLLIEQNFINNPFLPEGRYFWGDNPVDFPTDKPCGVLYQKHKGRKGFELNEQDYVSEDQFLLNKRICDAKVQEDILMNKNPNLSVRLPWLKKMFPYSKIVIVVRNPVSNMYSFSKKSYSLHFQMTSSPFLTKQNRLVGRKT